MFHELLFLVLVSLVIYVVVIVIIVVVVVAVLQEWAERFHEPKPAHDSTLRTASEP